MTSAPLAVLLPNPDLPWPIVWAGVVLIAEREGNSLVAYQCEAGVWTCGRGETEGVTPATRWTQDYADKRFCDSLREVTQAVLIACTRTPTPHQLAAMVSLAYNIGPAAFRGSTVLKAHNRGDADAAARAFKLWNKVRDPQTGKLRPSRGLTSRRAAEEALYLQPEPGAPQQPSVQAVAPESSLASSPIGQAAAVTGAAGVVQLVAQAGDQVSAVGGTVTAVRSVLVDGLGLPPEYLLPVVLIAAAGVGLWWRWRQRRDGWA
ncbi:lysozyme [Rubrivivax sp. JA1026]|uniref:lysozyme n=1 Tax=Rubrivivax sp. JA1026 TaxID=2710888 RepID=UPI0013E98498|nr:lysozyme [Rubrivivax sp. JA1026]